MPLMSVAPTTDPDLFGRLIGFDTTSCQPTRPVADFVSGYLADAGCDVREYPYADAANECIAEDRFARAGRLLERFIRQRCCP